jgi:uncharacterized protein (TIGR02598 family)
VEVVLAIGVISFAFVAILGLLPAGLQQFRQAMDTSVCAQIAQRIILDCQQTDLTNLNPSNSQAPYFQAVVYSAQASAGNARKIRYFDEQGNEILPAGTTPSSQELAQIVYHVNTRIAPATGLPGTAGQVVNTGLATITVQVAFNPSGKTIPINALSADSSSLLFTSTSLPPGTIKTYCAQIGRND